jgi:glycosyltransferase involved in cell wall biosynthesis
MKVGFVLLSDGPFGGAQRRFLNLFFYLSDKYPGDFIFFLTQNTINQIAQLYPAVQNEHIICVDPHAAKTTSANSSTKPQSTSAKHKSIIQILKRSFLYQPYLFYKSYRWSLKYFKKIDDQVKALNIDCLMGIYAGILPLYHYLSGKKTRPGIIFSNMDSWFSNLGEAPEKDWHKKYSLFNLAHTKSDIVDFLSPFILEGVRKRGIDVPEEKVRITACSFTDLSRCHVGDKSTFKVVFAARLEKDKNPLLYLEAALILAKAFPDAEFNIMGEGRLSGIIADKIRESAMPNIIFHGFHNEPTAILAASSVFVSIQTTNNYPSQSVLEAMACGNAIIASDVGDTRMFVNTENGSLIPLELEALTMAMRKYLKNPELAKKQGNFAAKYVREHFSVEKAAAYYLQLFQEAANVNTPNKAF